MPFLGSTPATGYISVAKQTITGDGNTAYSLNYSITNQNDLEVFVNNLRQEPGVAYSASGTTITFSEAVTSNDSIYILYQGRAVGTVNPPNGSVSASSLASGAVEAAMVTPFGMRNRIINGDMRIDQRNVGAAIASLGQYSTYTVDRWLYYGEQSGKFSFQQNQGSVTPPAGYKNYAGLTSLSAYSLGSTETFSYSQYVEGFNIADLEWGTANAKTLTLSFWVRSSLTGTFSGMLSGGQTYIFNYTINSANTWEQKTLTISGSTSGTWSSTNTAGIRVYFTLGYGSSKTGTSNTWQAAGPIATSGSVNLVSNNAATWYVTGVQLEVGSVATEFERRPYGTELALCQRYYEKSYDVNGTIGSFTNGFSSLVTSDTSTGDIAPNLEFKVTKRTTPTVVVYNAVSGASGALYRTSDANSISVSGINYVGANRVGTFTLASGSVNKYLFHWTASAEL